MLRAFNFHSESKFADLEWKQVGWPGLTIASWWVSRPNASLVISLANKSFTMAKPLLCQRSTMLGGKMGSSEREHLGLCVVEWNERPAL